MSGNWQLAVESSASRASVAAGMGGSADFSAELEAIRQSEVLMAPLTEVLAKLPQGAGIELVLIGTGPGSYNGARVGIAAGQGVALVHGCPALGICSLEAIPAVRAGQPCLAVGDARRGSFSAIPLRGGRLSGEPELLPEVQFVERVEGALRAGDTIVTVEDPGRLPEAVRSCCESVVPSAALLLEAWEAKSAEEREAILKTPPQPFYLRPPYVTTAKGA